VNFKTVFGAGLHQKLTTFPTRFNAVKMLRQEDELILIHMGAIKDIFDLCTKLRGEVEDRKTGEAAVKVETLALAPQSEQGAGEKKHAMLLTEIAGLQRKLLDMEISHTRAMAAIQERHREEMAKNTASLPKPNDELDLKTLEILKYIFNRTGQVSEREIARRFRMELNAASFHTFLLWKKKYIRSADAAAVGFPGGWDDDSAGGDNSARYEITVVGRKSVVEIV
jgi:hypothetical protein